MSDEQRGDVRKQSPALRVAPLKPAFTALQRLNMEPPCPARYALQSRFSRGNVGPNNFEMGSNSLLIDSVQKFPNALIKCVPGFEVAHMTRSLEHEQACAGDGVGHFF